MKTLSSAAPIPKFLQISDLLHRQISAGHFRTDERLPTEANLAQSLNVAIGTVRKALDVLEAQHVVERIQGSGTYVRNSRTGKSIYEFFRLELHDGPAIPTAQILSVDKLAHPTDVPVFNLKNKNNSAWRVRRLRFLNHKPVALEEIWFDAQLARQLDAAHLGDSMYLFYQKNFNIWISRVEDHVFVQPSPNWRVSQFGIPEKKMAGYVERLSFTTNNKLAEFSKTWFDPNLCRYSSRINQ
jgi:GntR family transcriptional regulator